MKLETQKLIAQATAGLRLRNIVLFQANFDRAEQSGDGKPADAVTQSKRYVRYGSGAVEENGSTRELLQVIVALGTRLVTKGTEDQPEPKVIVEIQAEYLVDYDVTSPISTEAIKEFCEFNSVHNVWPFWRQHVFDICQRGALPLIEIPLYAGMVALVGESSARPNSP